MPGFLPFWMLAQTWVGFGRIVLLWKKC